MSFFRRLHRREIFLLHGRQQSTTAFIEAARRPALQSAMFTDETALWTIAAAGRVEGCVVREGGRWRLSWFDGADRRLASYAGPVDDDLVGLAAALGARLGQPVELQSLPS